MQNKIFILEYIKNNYFIYHLELGYSQLIKTKNEIKYFLYDITSKSLQHDNIILVMNNKILKKFNFNKFTKINNIEFYTKTNVELENLNDKSNFSSFSEFNNNHFIIMTKNYFYLLEKFQNTSILIQTIDISFTLNPYFFKFKIPNSKEDEFYLISSEFYIYRIKICDKNNESFSIFKDLSLNFNNEKYFRLLETLKIIIYFNLEIDKLEFSKLKIYMNNIFQEYDIFSYVENLNSVLSEENIVFFITHNLNSSKLQVIFLFCLIFENCEFLKNVLKLINSNGTNLKNEIENNYDLSNNLFLTTFIQFILEFYQDFFSFKNNQSNNSIPIPILIYEFFSKCFEQENNLLKYIENYLEI